MEEFKVFYDNECYDFEFRLLHSIYIHKSLCILSSFIIHGIIPRILD